MMVWKGCMRLKCKNLSLEWEKGERDSFILTETVLEKTDLILAPSPKVSINSFGFPGEGEIHAPDTMLDTMLTQCTFEIYAEK
jgi:hypothetical protein